MYKSLDSSSGGANYFEAHFNNDKVKFNLKAYFHFKKAIDFYRANQISDARSEIEKCIDAEPSNQNSYFYYGYILEEIPDYVRARSAYLKSLSICPAQCWVSFRLGICYISLKNYESAVLYFTQALNDFYPFSESLVGYELHKEQIYTNRAIAYANLEEADKAIEDCTVAIEINSNYSNSFFIRGLEYLKRDQMNEAEIDLNKALSLKHPKAASILAEYFHKKSDIFEEIKLFAESEQARLNAGGRRPRDNYRDDILNYLQSNNLEGYTELVSFCNKFLNEIWMHFNMQNVVISSSSKAYFTYELVDAICSIYPFFSQRKLFNDLFKDV